MADSPCHPVESSNKHDVKAMSPSIGQQLIESRSLRSALRNDVAVLLHDFISALFGHFAEVEQLCFKMLVAGQNPAIMC